MAEEPREKLPGEEYVGLYRIVARLGEGGMGTVYRAEQKVPIRRTVAIKVIRGEFASDHIIARFEAERQALARMDHPNISKVLDAGNDKGRPYFVMELAPGVPVTKFCDENKLSIEARLELFVRICDAIAHAHTKAILHRDIKSGNVLAYFADGKPTVKVIDFGIAKAMTDDRLSDRLEVTQVGRPIGTYETMSPEQVEGAADVDTRTDVYALGVLLYEMLCGHKPFADLMKKGTSELGIQQVIREIEPTRPSDRVSRKADDSMTPEISDARRISPPELERKLRNELEWIPLKAMRKDRDRRYASPLEMAEDIENYLADRPLRAGPESRAYRLRKYLVRNRLGVLSAAAVILLLVAGVSFYIHNIRAEQQKTSAALAEVTRQKAEAERETATADAVVGFQTDMLSQADPEHAKGDRVTVVEAMAAAIKKLDDGALNDEPIAEQKVRMTAATTLLALGQYAEAERQARLSVALARRCLPAGDLQIGFAIEQLANVLRDSTR
jgi:serine/threonine protein kinase